MKFSRRTFFAALFLVLASYSSTDVQGTQSGSRVTRVLFIGNSYTYFNNLPEIFAKLAESGHQGKVEIRMVAPGGWRLKDHWEKGEALQQLRASKWDYVVLQEQSTLGVNYYVEGRTRISSDAVFKPYADMWAAEVRKAGAIPVFYLTWARKATPEDQAALNYFYMRAAKESGAVVAPVGIAWALVRRQQPEIELFFNDGSHPSPAGSYLAACTFYAIIFNKDPAGLPARISGVPVNSQTAQPEPGKTSVLVDLPSDGALAIQSAAWSARQQINKNGGYLDVRPVSTPDVTPLPAGEPLSTAKLSGTWSGKLLFYPVGPVEMVLQLRPDGATWKGHLELKYHSKDFPDESLDLADLQVGDRELTFSDPKSPGVNNLQVHFRAVLARAGELRGTAETGVERPDSPLRLLGTWKLQRK